MSSGQVTWKIGTKPAFAAIPPYQFSLESGSKIMRLILIVLLVLLLIGAFPVWPYSAGWGYYPTGGLGLILVIVVIVLLVG
jgi:Protein of unknown function (DUF3309)